MEESNKKWKGYTLQEIRVKRIVNLTKIELEQAKFKQMTSRFSSKSGFKSGLPIIGKMFSALDYIDYTVLAFKLGRRVYSLFRHHKG